MQDHGAIIGPQYALAWVRAEENGLQSNTTAASSSKQQHAAAIGKASRPGWDRMSAEIPPGSLARDCSPARNSATQLDGVVCCEMKVAFFQELPAVVRAAWLFWDRALPAFRARLAGAA